MKPTSLPLLLLMLSACATSSSPAPELLQAAAPMPAARPPPMIHTFQPPPPHTPAGAGAPTVGQPGQHSPAVQRSGNWRPGGKGPELMAPDGARASSGEGRPWWDLKFERPEGVPMPAFEHCAQDARDLLSQADAAGALPRNINGPARACLGFLLHKGCLVEFFHLATSSADPEDLAFAQLWPGFYDERAFTRAHVAAYNLLCRDEYNSDGTLRRTAAEMLNANRARWERQARGTGGAN